MHINWLTKIFLLTAVFFDVNGQTGTNHDELDVTKSFSDGLILHTFTGPNLNVNGITYINSETRIYLKTEESTSGESGITYSINGDSERTYQEAIRITEPGLHRITYKNKVNTKALKQTLAVFSDTTGPDLQIDFTFKSIKLGKVLIDATHSIDDTKVKRFPLGTSVALSAKDDHLDVSLLSYSLDNSDDIDYREPFSLPKGEHILYLNATDNLGNTWGRKKLRFEVVP